MDANLIERVEEATGHCAYGPSQLKRIISCNGSVRESAKFIADHGVEEPSFAARQGTYLHSVTEDSFNHGNEYAYKKHMPDDDQWGWVQEAKAYYLDFFSGCSNATVPWYELTGNIKWLGLPMIWGTSDAPFYDPVYRTLHVMDWKYGNWIVKARRNDQLMAYAGVTIQKLIEIYGESILADIGTIYVHIVQPKVIHYDSWHFDLDELRTWAETVVKPAIAGANSEEPNYNPTRDNCFFCPGKTICPARNKDKSERADNAFAGLAERREDSKPVDKEDNIDFLI